MAGRKRRGSTSSVETREPRSVHWRQESSVLRAPTSGTPDDEWPIFELTDAVVLNKDGKTIENALDVLLKGPFKVRGNMVVDDAEQRRHLIMKVRSSVPLEISTCTRYSIGEAEDETDATDIDKSRRSLPPVLWLSGRGAWFEINPSAEYLPTYREICEAIRLYYAIYDIYSAKPPRAMKRLAKSTNPIDKLSEVFFQYTIKVGNGLTIEEVAQRCHELAPFFVSQFLEKESEHNFWKDTFFYKWIKDEHGELFGKALNHIQNPHKLPISTISSRDSPGTSRRSQSTATSTNKNVAVTKTRSTRSRSPAVHEEPVTKNSGKEDNHPVKDASRKSTRSQSVLQQEGSKTQKLQSTPVSQASLPQAGQGTLRDSETENNAFNSVREAFEWACREQSSSRRGVAMSTIINKVYFANKFPNFKNGKTGCHRVPVEEVFHYNAAALLDAIDHSQFENSDVLTWLKDKAETEFDPISLKHSDFPYFIVPRSKSSRPHQPKGPPNAQSSTPIHKGSSLDDDEDSSMSQPRTPRHIGKSVKTPGRLVKSSLRPATGSKKRPHSDVDSDSELESPGAKKSHYFSDDEDDSMEDTDPNIKIKDDDGQPIEISIRANKIPSTVPHGPNETWTCDQEECDYMVRGGDAAECQERIRQHFEEHEQQLGRVQLAMTESTRGHLPVNHLLEKIKKLGEQSQQGEELSVGGITLPQAIRRKVIV